MAKQDCAKPSRRTSPIKANEKPDESGKWQRFKETRIDGAARTSAFRVTGVRRNTAEDVHLTVEAATPKNARVKAEILGIVVTEVAAAPARDVSLESKRKPAGVASGRQGTGTDPDEAVAIPEPIGFAAARWSSWPKALGAVSLAWGGLWVLGGVVGFLVGFTAGRVFLHWSSDFVDLLLCAFMVLYGSLAIKAGHRLTRHLRSSMWLEKFVWGIAFLMGLAYLFWPRSRAPGGIAVTVVFLVMSVAYPIFLFLWFSDNTIKRQVNSWPRLEDLETQDLYRSRR